MGECEVVSILQARGAEHQSGSATSSLAYKEIRADHARRDASGAARGYPFPPALAGDRQCAGDDFELLVLDQHLSIIIDELDHRQTQRGLLTSSIHVL